GAGRSAHLHRRRRSWRSRGWQPSPAERTAAPRRCFTRGEHACTTVLHMTSAARGSGPDGNAQLTALTGLALVAPLAAVFLTGLLFGSMRSIHFFVGFVLVPLVAVKLASTLWRVTRY